MVINAKGLDFQELNNRVRQTDEKIEIKECFGQRFIGSGMSGKDITISGVPGNALGAYLNGSTITVNGNAQDAVGDTMNEGLIVINGNIGDAPGYAMRGGRIYVKGCAGYRAGIHMKQYKEKKPVLIVGETTGSFLGEYQAGGLIAVLNLKNADKITGNFTGTGMHGGKIFLRGDRLPDLPKQVEIHPASEEEMVELEPYLSEYCSIFGLNMQTVLDAPFHVIRPNSKNPYKKMYTNN